MKELEDAGDDDFWSVAMLPPPRGFEGHSDEEVEDSEEAENPDSHKGMSTKQSFMLLPPTPSQEPLHLDLWLNCEDGILSDVSGIPWDAALLLAGYLYGTEEGRQLCYEACFKGSPGLKCGILELGSGLGVVGMAAVAAALSVHGTLQRSCTDHVVEKETKDHNHMVLTDRDDDEILSHLKKMSRQTLVILQWRAPMT
ncbi:hypothetical protein ACHAWF_015892 [Thalassiosira exigua]